MMAIGCLTRRSSGTPQSTAPLDFTSTAKAKSSSGATSTTIPWTCGSVLLGVEGKPLRGELKGSRSHRFGSYRILYEVRHGELLVIVIDLGHRREIHESKLNA